MSFKRSVFFSLGRPAPKPVPLNVIARIGHTHIIPEEKPKEEVVTPVVESQIDAEKLTQAITDAIDKALKPAVGPTDPEDDSEEGQQNNTTSTPQTSTTTTTTTSTRDFKDYEDVDAVPAYDDVVVPLSEDEETFKRLDPELYNDARRYAKERGIKYTFKRRKAPYDERWNTLIPESILFLNNSFDNPTISYTVYDRTFRPQGQEAHDIDSRKFKNFKEGVYSYNHYKKMGDAYPGDKLIWPSIKGFLAGPQKRTKK